MLTKWNRRGEVISVLLLHVVVAVLVPSGKIFIFTPRCVRPHLLSLGSFFPVMPYMAESFKFSSAWVDCEREYQTFLFIWTYHCLIVFSHIYLKLIALLHNFVFLSIYYVCCCCLSIVDVSHTICVPCLSTYKSCKITNDISSLDKLRAFGTNVKNKYCLNK